MQHPAVGPAYGVAGRSSDRYVQLIGGGESGDQTDQLVQLALGQLPVFRRVKRYEPGDKGDQSSVRLDSRDRLAGSPISLIQPPSRGHSPASV